MNFARFKFIFVIFVSFVLLTSCSKIKEMANDDSKKETKKEQTKQQQETERKKSKVDTKQEGAASEEENEDEPAKEDEEKTTAGSQKFDMSAITAGSYGQNGAGSPNLTIPYEKVGTLDKKVSGVSGAIREGTNIKFFARAKEVDAYRKKFNINTSKYPVQLRGDLTIWADTEMKKETVEKEDYYLLTVPLNGYSYDIFAWCVYLGDENNPNGYDKYLQDSYYLEHRNNPLPGWGPNKKGGGNQYYSLLK